MTTITPTYNQNLFDRSNTLGKSIISAMSNWLHDGHWHQSVDEDGRWGRMLAIPALAATIYRYDTTQTDYKQAAIDSIEAAFTWNLEPFFKATPIWIYPALAANGHYSHVFGQAAIPNRNYSFFAQGEWGRHPPEVAQDFETFEDLNHIIWTMDMLYFGPDGVNPSGGIDKKTVKRWLDNCKACMDWLYDINGHPAYYANGNLIACLMAAAGHLADFILRFEGPVAPSEWPRYKEIYEQCYFTLFTPSLLFPGTTYGSQFTGYGLVTDVAPIYFDWSDAFIHFTETSTHPNTVPTPNSDYVYGSAQMDWVSSLFSVTRDERLNRILNGIYNTLEARMNWTTFTMDCSGGSRQNGSATRPGMTGPFFVMSLMSGRYPPLRTTRLSNTTTMLSAWDTVTTGFAANLAPSVQNIPYGWATGATLSYCHSIAVVMHAAYQSRTKLT